MKIGKILIASAVNFIFGMISGITLCGGIFNDDNSGYIRRIKNIKIAMKTCLAVMLTAFLFLSSGDSFPEAPLKETTFFTKAVDYKPRLGIKVIRKIKLPKGYHEGLMIQGNNIWVNNGKNGKTWVIDIDSGLLVAAIDPVGTFSEGITGVADNKYWVTDWDAKELYLVRIEHNKMVKESAVSLDPSYPAGITRAGSHLYVITWTRGIGTKYHLLKLDMKGNTLEKTEIKNINEPSQLAWDGKNLWISSWFNDRVYKIDGESLLIKGFFSPRIKKTSGVAWDGKYIWVTGTYEGLYQIEIKSSSI